MDWSGQGVTAGQAWPEYWRPGTWRQVPTWSRMDKLGVGGGRRGRFPLEFSGPRAPSGPRPIPSPPWGPGEVTLPLALPDPPLSLCQVPGSVFPGVLHTTWVLVCRSPASSLQTGIHEPLWRAQGPGGSPVVGLAGHSSQSRPPSPLAGTCGWVGGGAFTLPAFPAEEVPGAHGRFPPATQAP